MLVRRLVQAVVAGVLVVGCSAFPAPSGSPSALTTREVLPAAATPSGATPSVSGLTPVARDDALVDELGVSCGDGAVFPAGRLDETGQAHLGEDPLARALREFLASSEGSLSGAPSWLLVELTDEYAQFLGRRAADRWTFVRFAWRDGGWVPDVFSDCAPQVAIEAGQFAVPWTLDPTTREVTEGQAVGLLLDTVPCDPGDPPLEYVERPLVAMRPDRIEIVVLAREDASAEYCRGPFPIRLDLPEPDRDRPIVDGATFPPQVVEAGAP